MKPCNVDSSKKIKATLDTISYTLALGLMIFFLIKYWVHWFRATKVEYTNVNLHRVVQLLHASHGLVNSNSHNSYNSNNNYNRRKVIPKKKKKLEYLDTQSPSYSTLISPWLLPQFESYQTESRENYMYYLKTIPCL